MKDVLIVSIIAAPIVATLSLVLILLAANGKEEKCKRRTCGAIVMICLTIIASCLALYSFYYIDKKNIAPVVGTEVKPESEPEVKPEPEPESELEAEPEPEPESELEAEQPEETKITATKKSLLEFTPERFKKTGFYDAVTYDFYDTEIDWLSKEVKRNPFFLAGIANGMEYYGLLGESEWYTEQYAPFKYDYFHWLDGDVDESQYRKNENITATMSEEYEDIANNILNLFKSSEDLGVHSFDEGWKLVKHWPMNPEKEELEESSKKENFNFYLYKFATKEGEEFYIGINVIDGRAMIVDKKVKASKNVVTTPKTNKPRVTPAPTPDPTTTPDPINPDPTNPDPTPTPKEKDKDPQYGPDAQGNAPTLGTGEDGKSDNSAGTIQNNEPTHVDNDGDPTSDTITQQSPPADAINVTAGDPPSKGKISLN